MLQVNNCVLFSEHYDYFINLKREIREIMIITIRPIFLHLSTSFIALILTGCAHFSVDSDYIAPAALSNETQTSYHYPKYRGSYSESIIEANSYYTLKNISFPSQHNTLLLQHNISIDYYAINSEEKAPIILVLPIFGGSNEVAIHFANYFSKNGFSTAIVHRQNSYKNMQYMDQTENIMQQIIFDHKQAIDWIETREELDARKIGVFGVSMGGIKSALISAIDPRVNATVIALAAGDLPYLLAQSSDNRISKDREKLLIKDKIDEAQLEQRLSKTIECDPINYAEHIDANKTLMILALFDTVIPFRKGLELKEKIGNPETIYLFSGHYSALLYLPYVQYQSRKFLEKNLQ